MKRPVLLLTALLASSQMLPASPKSDSIVAFTGARTKIVWLRLNWCNADYTQKGKPAAEAAGVSAMLFDTDEGQERVLGTGLSTVTQHYNQDHVRISRSGRWATVAEKTCTYIMDLDGTNPNKRKFLDNSTCTFFAVKAWGRDSATCVEYAYTIDNFRAEQVGAGTAIYKVPVKSDGTADVANAVKIPVSGSPNVDGALSVSADLKKIGGLYPWPDNPGILDAATGTITQRKNGPSCHANIAADNSYRFFHENDDHNGIVLFDKNLSTTNWLVSLETNMVNSLTGQFWSPRWSNNPQFVASTFPQDDGDGLDYVYAWPVATIKTKPLGSIQFCLLQKLSADFRSIEKSMAVAADIRNFEYMPDVWVASGYTGGGACPTGVMSANRQSNRAPNMQITRNGSILSIDHGTAGTPIGLMDAQGRVVLRLTAVGRSIDLSALCPGAYVVSVAAGDGSKSRGRVAVR